MIIKHVVLYNIQKCVLKNNNKDYEKLINFFDIYRKSFNIVILSYGIDKDAMHILVYDNGNDITGFLEALTETFNLYYNKENDSEKNLSYKVYLLEEADLINSIKCVHKLSYNSLPLFLNYSRYKDYSFVNPGFVINTYTDGSYKSKTEFLEELVREPDAAYQTLFYKRGKNIDRKIVKRRNRARSFLNTFLKDNQINYNQLLNDKNKDLLFKLIKKFRVETDLSYRDIASVLGVSHTTVIRIYKMG